ncbi:MAG: UPF0489 family protein [Candidatus Omnitrophica bacterium]|nr:UPF0489 family protein [Candidatus Omnitrophota bacterium]
MKKLTVKLIEDHDESYHLWRKTGLKNRVLLHLDAHIDFGFPAVKSVEQAVADAHSREDLKKELERIVLFKRLKGKEERLIHIGNYIHPAIRDGIVSEFWWVIPGDKKEFEKSSDNIKNILKRFSLRDPHSTKKISLKNGRLCSVICGINFIVTTLDSLPAQMKDVLLDIDTDYFIIDTIRKANSTQNIANRKPWIFPNELFKILKHKKIEPVYVTIAYSVNGGWTPMIYRSLGDEVALCFKGMPTKLEAAIQKKNKGLKLFNKNKIKQSINLFKDASREIAQFKTNPAKKRFKANVAFLLFKAHLKLNALKKARLYYNLAIEFEPAYRLKDNNYGPLYIRKKEKEKAESEFKNILKVDKNNPYALSGLAEVLLKKRDYKKARALFVKSLKQNKANKEAILGLAKAEFKLKNYKSAINYLLKYQRKDRVQGFVPMMLAQSYEKLGEFDKALREYRRSLSFGINPDVYHRLFRLIKKIDIKEKDKGWIRDKMDIYKSYKEKID